LRPNDGSTIFLFQLKAAIARLVFNYRILKSEKTVDKLIPDPMSRSMLHKGGIWIKVEKRTRSFSQSLIIDHL